MRRLLISAAALGLMACAVLAGPQFVSFEVNHGTTSTNVLTQSRAVHGYVDEVYVSAPSRAGVTANVYVASTPAIDTGLTSTEIYTNAAVTAAAKARPRIAQTDTEGTDLSSLTVPERLLCVGDTVTLRVVQSSAVTGVVYKVRLKVDQ